MTAPARALPPLILGVLALVSAVEPLSINMYLSGLPQLGRDLEIGAAGAQLTLTFFLAGMAIGQLLTGPLSDARGRRGLFLTGVLVLALGSALSALAPVAWVLFASRFLMGLSAGMAVVLARAVAGDLTRGPELARVFSLLMMLGGVASVIGPVVGGLIVDGVGWRGVFWLLFALNLATALAVWKVVPETLPAERRTTGGAKVLFAAIGRLLRDRVYVGYTLGFIFSFSTMFAYVSASPFVLQVHHGFTPVQYSLIFAMNTTGMFIVSLINARVVRRVGPQLMARVGNLVLLAAIAYLVVVTAADLNRWFLVAGLFVVVASMGLNFANNSALAISRAKGLTGSASAFMGAGQFLIAGALTPLVGTVSGMVTVMAFAALVATAGIWWVAR